MLSARPVKKDKKIDQGNRLNARISTEHEMLSIYFEEQTRPSGAASHSDILCSLATCTALG